MDTIKMDTKNILAEVAVRGNTASSILYKSPRWILVWLFGENTVKCLEEIDELCSTQEWRTAITTALYSKKSK